jgi:hypothetical protein
MNEVSRPGITQVRRLHRWSGFLLAPLLAWLPVAWADDPLADWAPVDDAVLADARGGFETGNGLLVSLAVDRLISVNGNVVASSKLALDELAGMGTRPSGFQYAAVGEGNALALTGSLQPLAGLVLQNSANDQLIRSQTTINASVNTLSTLKGLNFGDSLHQALSTAILPR